MFDDFKARLETLLDVPQVLGTINERISLLAEVMYKWRDKPEPAPFVCIVAFCEVLERTKASVESYAEPRFGFRLAEEEPRVVQATLGVSGYIKHEQQSFFLDPHVQLRKFHIVVFCDLERVLVQDCKAGNESLSASGISTNPVFYYDGVLMPGSRITIQCARRAPF